MRAPEQLYHLPAARLDEQRRTMEDLEAAGVCIFCPEHVADHQRGAVVVRGEHWYVVENDFPYAGTTAHWLIVPHRHVAAFDELPDAAGAELWAIKRQLKAQVDPVATATVERSGDMRYNGGSVAHLHVHFVVPELAPAKPVRFRVSSAGS